MQQKNYIQLSLFGRTCPEPSAPTEAKTSGASSNSSAKSKIVVPLYLCLQKENGQTPDLSWGTGIPSDGESSMPNFGAYPKDVEESTLSQILQAGVPERYYLSAKACKGILRKCAAHGKELPEILKAALERQAQSA